MASTYDKKFKTTETTKAAGAEVVSDPIELSPRTKNHILTVTTDSSLSGTVDVEMEMSPDGTNWCPAVSRTVSGGSGTQTGDVIGNEESVKLTPDAGEFKNKHARGGLNFDVNGAVVTPDGSGARDLMHQHIDVSKSFNYSQWFKTSENPTTTYKPVLFRHGGYDNFENLKAVQLTDTTTQNLSVVNFVNGNYLRTSAPTSYTNSVLDTSGGTVHSPMYSASNQSNTADIFSTSAGSLSIGFWFRNNLVATSSTRYKSIVQFTLSNGWKVELALRGDSSGNRAIGFFVRDGNSSKYFKYLNLNAVKDGNWHYMLWQIDSSGTYGGGSLGTNFFIDGTRYTQGSAFGNISNLNATNMANVTITNLAINTGSFTSVSLLEDQFDIDSLVFIKGYCAQADYDAIYKPSNNVDNTNNPYNATLGSGKSVISFFRFGDGPNDSISTPSSATIEGSNYIELTSGNDTPTFNTYLPGVATELPREITPEEFPSIFDTTANSSISGWFKTSDTGTLFSNTAGAVIDGLKMEVNASNMVLTLIDSSQTITASTDVDDDEWHHLVITKPSGTTPTIKIYIDGSESVSTTVTTISNDDLRGSNGFTLLGDGQENAGNASPASTDASKLAASLSNWSLHSEVLSAEAVKQLYSNGHVRNIKNLPNVNPNTIVSWWKLSDTTTPEEDSVGSNDLQYFAFTTGNKYAATSNTATLNSIIDYRINGTEKSLFPSLSTGTNTFPPLSSAWTITFWLYMPSSGTTLSNSNRECLLKTQVGTAQGGMQVFMRGTNTLECYISGTSAGNYFYESIGTGFSYDAWNLITIDYDGNYSLNIYANGNTSSGGGGTAGSTATVNTQLSNATINNTEMMSIVYTPAGGSAVARANRFYRMDELTAYDIQLNSTQRSEVYNSGAPKDPSTLTFASNVESHFKFGDGINDSLTNYYAYDDNDNTRYFEPVSAGTRSFALLTSNDSIYVAPPSPSLSDNIIDATGSVLVENTINGNAMTLSLTKSFNFTTKEWVATADQDTALCLSFNGFEEQAEYFALWKCSQTIAGSTIDICDGDWHNVILSYRGKNDLAGDNVDPGDTVKFGPGPADNLPYNWAISYDGEPLTAIQDGSGADYIGGLNTLVTDTYSSTTYNVGFAIQDRHLKYESSNTEEVYKPHAQFSAGIHEVVGVDNNNAFQGYVDETSFHSDTWWVDQAGTSVTQNQLNAEKPAAIYGNTTALSNRGAGAEYPVGVPYPLLNPEKLNTSGQASDIEGTNQYINPNRYDASTNPNGGLEGWWRWGDTPGDCSITINDVRDHTNSINARDIDAFGIVTADRQLMTSADSIFNADAAASTGGGTTITFPQVKIEGIQQGICNLSNINSPLLQYVRVKIKGAGSMDLGEGKGQARLNYTNRRRRRKK